MNHDLALVHLFIVVHLPKRKIWTQTDSFVYSNDHLCSLICNSYAPNVLKFCPTGAETLYCNPISCGLGFDCLSSKPLRIECWHTPGGFPLFAHTLKPLRAPRKAWGLPNLLLQLVGNPTRILLCLENAFSGILTIGVRSRRPRHLSIHCCPFRRGSRKFPARTTATASNFSSLGSAEPQS